MSDNAKPGTSAKDWACTKDSKTGLIWEVKTTDGGLRDWNKTYTNYTTDYPKCDNNAHGISCEGTGKLGDSTNTDGFVTAINSQSLCGASNWRLPTIEELEGLVYCSSGEYNRGLGCKDHWWYLTESTAINETYFPNTNAWSFWSSTPHANDSYSRALSVFFRDGYSFGYFKDGSYNVRLVRG